MLVVSLTVVTQNIGLIYGIQEETALFCFQGIFKGYTRKQNNKKKKKVSAQVCNLSGSNSNFSMSIRELLT